MFAEVFARNFANPAALIEQHAVWSLILQIALGAVGGAIVKACFALRVWRCMSIRFRSPHKAQGPRL